jgi:hypothetical protein
MFFGRALVVLGMLSVCVGWFAGEAALPVSEVAAPVVASVPTHSPATISAAAGTKLLVLVIAGGSTARFGELRRMWLEAAERAVPLGVVVYLVSFGKETRVDKHSIVFRGTDSFVPGVLNETIMAMDLIKRQQLPGADFVHFLRTNLSSFLRFPLLLSFLSRMRDRPYLYAGFKLKNPDMPPFASGAGFLLNRASYDLILKKQRELWYNTVDDVAIGFFLYNEKIFVAPAFTFCVLEEASLARDFRFSHCNKAHFLYRIKTGDPELDLNIWKHLAEKEASPEQDDDSLQ